MVTKTAIENFKKTTHPKVRRSRLDRKSGRFSVRVTDYDNYGASGMELCSSLA